MVKPSLSRPSLRREALRTAATRSVAPLERNLEMEPPQGTGDYLRKPIDEFRPDTTNPRWAETRPPTWEELTGPLENVKDREIRKEVEMIHGLKNSMHQIGQRQPIEVWRNGSWLEITDGERRYWAAKLLGWTHLDVKVLPERPARSKLVQFIVNFQRRDLKPRQALTNLQNILIEAKETGNDVATGPDFVKLVGFTETTGFRWWGILQGPQDVRDAILSGRIQSVRDAYEITKEDDSAKRAAMIQDPAASRNPFSSPASPPNPKTTSTRGRRAQQIRFGNTTSPGAARYLFERADPEGKFTPTDWSNLNQINKAWRSLMEKLERQFPTG
jgi:ParB-like nuclease domain